MPNATSPTRRDFLKSTSIAGGAAAAALAFVPAVHGGVDDTIRVGLIGCGGRGTGAAGQALNADKGAKLIAMGDMFPDRLESSHRSLSSNFAKQPGKVDVPGERRFTGFDAYKQVLDAGVDVVILTTPPHFRPLHLKAAVDAGKHIFCEKPVAVDGPGVRSVLETAKAAKEKGVCVVSGLCWRYHYGKRETVAKIHEGAIGPVRAIHSTYLTDVLWHNPPKPDWSEMEYQLRNWLYYCWLSGDHIVEQHIHSLDKAAWVLGDQTPLSAVGLGGRQVRTSPLFGNIYDHHAVTYSYKDDVKVFAATRQMASCKMDVNDHVIGAKGSAHLMQHEIVGENPWKYTGPQPDMYQVEHNELFAAIRAGKRIDNCQYMAQSTLMAIMGRMATYTGAAITWEDALNSKEDLTPPKYELGPLPVAPVPLPGKTKFV